MSIDRFVDGRGKGQEAPAETNQFVEILGFPSHDGNVKSDFNHSVCGQYFWHLNLSHPKPLLHSQKNLPHTSLFSVGCADVVERQQSQL